mmetsp:Transcript_9770/g.16021  ORF Transcript_9770/g.16021 Transcript_9770/m.16021 type:complete len:112 (-) Transcript_9770:1141-1476(-)
MILKFLSRRAAAPNTPPVAVAVAAAVAEPEKRTNAMADAWAAIAGAFQEVASDMHAVIVADEEALKKKRREEEEEEENLPTNVPTTSAAAIMMKYAPSVVYISYWVLLSIL